MSKNMKKVLFFLEIHTFIMLALKRSPVEIVRDNQGAIKTASNRHLSKRTRHIYIEHRLIRDAVDEGKVSVTYIIGVRGVCSTEYNTTSRKLLDCCCDALKSDLDRI